MFFLKRIQLLIIVLIGFHVSAQNFSKEDVHSDLSYLRTSLEEAHIDLYAYTTKEAFSRNFDKVLNEIQKDSLSLFEVTNLFRRVVVQANNAHTTIDFPVKDYFEHIYSGGTNFPLELVVENQKVLIRKNWSSNKEIKIGSELKSINGKSIEEILNRIYQQIPAERKYFKNAQLESFSFPRFYWQVFGQEKIFEVVVQQNEGRKTYKLNSIKAEDYETVRREFDVIKLGWKYEQLQNSIAYLRPGQFGGDLDKYKKFIDSAFVEVHKNKLSNLIIDLRNHPGGDDPFGDYLVSYFADKPFKWNSKFVLKTSALLKEHTRKKSDTTKAYAKSILSHKNGELYEYDMRFHQPQSMEKRYKGKVFVLVNRHSYSQSTVTAAQIQDYGFGTIVGEETAEYPNLHASLFEYQLPKTGIVVKVPKGKIFRVSGIDNGKGVIPDVIIKEEPTSDKDEILEGLLKRFSNN